MKIAVYAISKNEEQFVERFCESAKDADLILVGDTGSTDGTVKALKKCGAKVMNLHIKPWRFDMARNAVLTALPKDIDLCIALDLDEVMMPGWREHIETLWKNAGGFTRLRYLYDWGNDLVFAVQKIHSRDGYLWKYPCHEYIFIDPQFKEKHVSTNELLIKHLPDHNKPRTQYLNLLIATVEENKHCPRSRFYLGREYTFVGNHWAATSVLEYYLKMPEADWNAERSYAMRLLGDSFVALGDDVTAEKWYRKATLEAPELREPWHALAKFLKNKGRNVEAFGAIGSAMRVKTHEPLYLIDPKSWDGSVESMYEELLRWVSTSLPTTQ